MWHSADKLHKALMQKRENSTRDDGITQRLELKKDVKLDVKSKESSKKHRKWASSSNSRSRSLKPLFSPGGVAVCIVSTTLFDPTEPKSRQDPPKEPAPHDDAEVLDRTELVPADSAGTVGLAETLSPREKLRKNKNHLVRKLTFYMRLWPILWLVIVAYCIAGMVLSVTSSERASEASNSYSTKYNVLVDVGAWIIVLFLSSLYAYSFQTEPSESGKRVVDILLCHCCL